MRITCLIVAFGLLTWSVLADYVPGTPGAAWSDQELAETKEKLTYIMENPEKALRQVFRGKKFSRLYDHFGDMDAILPTAAKIVRLAFHDCLPESDTGAGCNGCLNFEGMGNRYFLDDKCASPSNRWQQKKCRKLEGGLRPQQQLATDNNNLLWTAAVLEDLYHSHSYGWTDSEQSLFEAGKSRADLWAYASLVAVRHTLMNNNRMCETYQPTEGCRLEKNSETFCAFNLTTPDFLPVFRTGRSDCLGDCAEKWYMPEFCTTAHEVHPNPHGNGNETGEFMKIHFGLNVQEATAVLGAHSIGRTHKVNSMFRSKPWTPQGVQDWNNLYYINGVNYITVAEPNNSRSCRFVDPVEYPKTANGFIGDEYGKPISVKFKVRNEMMTANGGPWNWNLFGKGCDRTVCKTIAAADMDAKSCCHTLTYCDNRPEDCPFEAIECFGPEECSGHSVFLDINMLNVDMGLVFDFTTTADGRPQGCAGLDDPDWTANLKELSGEVDCPLNNAPSGLGKIPNTDIERTYFLEYEFYANNPRNWVVTFRKAFDKMLENKVPEADLQLAGTCWMDDTCYT